MGPNSDGIVPRSVCVTEQITSAVKRKLELNQRRSKNDTLWETCVVLVPTRLYDMCHQCVCVCVQTFMHGHVFGISGIVLCVCQSVCGEAAVQLSRDMTVAPSCRSCMSCLTLCCACLSPTDSFFSPRLCYFRLRLLKKNFKQVNDLSGLGNVKIRENVHTTSITVCRNTAT